MFIFLSSSFFTFFSFIIKSLTSTFFKKKLKEYVIIIHEYNESKSFKQWFFFDSIKAKCVHMHTSNFNLKEFNVADWQLISLHWLKTHVIIWYINDNECLKIALKVRMLSLLMIMSLWVITDNTLCILKRLTKQKNWKLMMMKKLNTVLQCFKLMKINIKTFWIIWKVNKIIFNIMNLY